MTDATAIKFASKRFLLWNVARVLSSSLEGFQCSPTLWLWSRRLLCVAGLCWALYGWFRLSIHRFDGVVAKDVLAAWDAKLAKLSVDDREQLRAQPPVAVLEALVALPSPRARRFQLTYIR